MGVWAMGDRLGVLGAGAMGVKWEPAGAIM